jgi:hypothetical protein
VNIRELLPRLDRLQHSVPFKIVASLVLIALALTAFTVYFVSVTAPGAEMAAAAAAMEEAARAAGQSRGAIDAGTQMLIDLADRRASPMNVGVGISLVTGVAITVVWLGLGLTYIALLAIALGVALPLSAIGFPAMSRILIGVVALTAAFVAMLQGMRLVFSGPGPVMGVARNVLIEAVRMKVALVFIVLLIFAMAALPGLLDPTTPLRYRVQSFLQYGTGGSYWIIAILVLFFSVGTVAFEQRDRQIWQTMTKPVTAWQYILGKWLGVMALAAVLLAVSCTGVFLFTEYLRKQPALGESVQMLVGQSMATEDRQILESQVLAARNVAEPVLPMTPRDERFLEGVRSYIIDRQRHEPGFGTNPAEFEKIKSDLFKSWEQSYRSIGPGDYRDFIIEGLGEARKRNEMISLRFRIDSAGNPPGVLYNLTFNFGGVTHPPQNVSLGPSQQISLFPQVIDEDGRVTLTVFNGALIPVDDPPGAMAIVPNPETITFPPGGLEISYSAGSFQMNFLRVALVLWLKLAFLSILGIAAATFLSFPVACLVAFSVFIAAEGAGFLANSVQYYDALDHDGNVVYWKIPIRAMGLGISGAFKMYAELRPTTRLVDGRLLSWGSVSWGASFILILSGVLFTMAVGIFRRRELATYSGH